MKIKLVYSNLLYKVSVGYCHFNNFWFCGPDQIRLLLHRWWWWSYSGQQYLWRRAHGAHIRLMEENWHLQQNKESQRKGHRIQRQQSVRKAPLQLFQEEKKRILIVARQRSGETVGPYVSHDVASLLVSSITPYHQTEWNVCKIGQRGFLKWALVCEKYMCILWSMNNNNNNNNPVVWHLWRGSSGLLHNSRRTWERGREQWAPQRSKQFQIKPPFSTRSTHIRIAYREPLRQAKERRGRFDAMAMKVQPSGTRGRRGEMGLRSALHIDFMSESEKMTSALVFVKML